MPFTLQTAGSYLTDAALELMYALRERQLALGQTAETLPEQDARLSRNTGAISATSFRIWRPIAWAQTYCTSFVRSHAIGDGETPGALITDFTTYEGASLPFWTWDDLVTSTAMTEPTAPTYPQPHHFLFAQRIYERLCRTAKDGTWTDGKARNASSAYGYATWAAAKAAVPAWPDSDTSIGAGYGPAANTGGTYYKYGDGFHAAGYQAGKSVIMSKGVISLLPTVAAKKAYFYGNVSASFDYPSLTAHYDQQSQNPPGASTGLWLFDGISLKAGDATGTTTNYMGDTSVEPPNWAGEPDSGEDYSTTGLGWYIPSYPASYPKVILDWAFSYLTAPV